MSASHDWLVLEFQRERRESTWVVLSTFGKRECEKAAVKMSRKQRKLLGRCIVVDLEICHGKPTFLGTRIMVVQVLAQVAKGMPWDAITAEWRGAVSKEAIAEAVELAP